MERILVPDWPSYNRAEMNTTALSKKLITADEAVRLIADGSTLAVGGFIGAAHPEALTAAIERNFLQTGRPRDLTLVYAAGQGDAQARGLNHLGHVPLLKRVIGGHWGLCPKLGRLALDNQIEAYNFPQGVICHLLRDIAAGRPGCITHVGLGTFIDPQQDGGKLNARTTEDLVHRIELAGQTWLMYQSFPIHVGLVRATAADSLGNLVMDEEAIIGDVLPIAQAAHNHGGLVIAQVKRLLDRPAHPQHVRVPGRLVNHVVLADECDHWQTFAEQYNSSYCSPAPQDTTLSSEACESEVPRDVRRLIAQRACDELPAGAIVNLGIGLPEGIARVAAERGLLHQVTLTVESGPIGGQPSGGLSFGTSAYPHAVIDQPAQFDFYDGGGLDFAALGAAQVDEHGNVNVSKFGKRFAGVGGFVNISQNAKRLVFCGTFTADGLEVGVEGERLKIIRDGNAAKFVARVEQVSFSGPVAREHGKDVLFVTERAVFRLVPQGIELIEVTAGVDIERDILARMHFRPLIRNVTIRRLS